MADTSTSALVRELARLAQLELGEDQVDALGGQLDTILGYLRRLQEVDVEGVPEYASAEQVRSGLRDDTPGPAFATEAALAGVPELDGRLVAVPKFMDRG